MSAMKLIWLSAAVLSVGACSIGTTKYQCPSPNGVACRSAKEMYESTNAPGDAGIRGARKLMIDADSRKPLDHARPSVIADGDALEYGPSVRAGGTTIVPDPGNTVPVRMPAQVMRVWINSWEDTDGSLHLGGRVFTEIVARHWSFGNLTVPAPRTIEPLQIDTPKPEIVPRPSTPATTTNFSKDPAVAQQPRHAPPGATDLGNQSAKANDMLSSGGGG